MSAPAPAPGTPTAPAGPGASRRWRTPEKLRAAVALSIVSSLFIAGFGLWLGLRQAALLDSAAARTDEAVSLLSVQTNLTLANATTTNAFLIGGLEPADLRLASDESFAAGASALASSAGGSAVADGTALADASADVAVYAGLIEQARAANRQGFPVGAAYLDQATTLLGQDILPVVDDAVLATADAAAHDFNQARGMVWLCLLLIVPVGALVGVQVWLARRTRRRFNVPFLIGTILVVACGVAAAATLNSSGARAQDLRESEYVPTLALGQALSDAAQARSDEAFTLIRRGSGGAYEQSFQENASSARAQLERADRARSDTATRGLVDHLDAWLAGHDEIRALDDAGDWDAAVELATLREDQSPSLLYQTFADETGAQMEQLASATTVELRRTGTAPVAAAWLLAAAGVACAVLSSIGLAARLKEYQ